ncbi:MAG: hypothetical protein ABSA96_11980 [Candidatus Acidiferrales bacterium]|jgi:hypothetical protein
MSNSIQSLQAVNAHDQAAQTVQPPPKPATSRTAIPQDTVAISSAAKQAQTSNTKPAASVDVDHDGDNH